MQRLEARRGKGGDRMVGMVQRIGKALLGGMLTAALLALPLPADAGPSMQGKVIKVSDGDTLVVQLDPNRSEKVRLLGIDTPEMAQEPWGARARAFTEQLALGKVVRLETDVQMRDRYGRLLAYAYVGKTFVNQSIIRQGHAMLLTYPPNVAHVEEFTRAQKLAREEGKGIWNPKDGLDQSPRDFRRQKRDGGDSSRDRVAPADSADRAPESAQAPASAGSVIGNSKSRVFHDSSCTYGAKIGSENRVVMPSAASAKAKGFTPCKRCGG